MTNFVKQIRGAVLELKRYHEFVPVVSTILAVAVGLANLLVSFPVFPKLGKWLSPAVRDVLSSVLVSSSSVVIGLIAARKRRKGGR